MIDISLWYHGHGINSAVHAVHRLRLQEVWWSSKHPSVQLTVSTGLTFSRLEQLEAQCEAWKGPISAAVYLSIKGNASQPSAGNLATIQNAVKGLGDFHNK